MAFSIYQLKPRFQQLLRPLIDGLARRHITPNQITVLAMFLSIGYGAALAINPLCQALWFGLPLFLLLRMALNAIDGMLATATGLKTRLGALLNEMGDVVSDIALTLPFVLVMPVRLVIAVVIAGLLAEFAGVLAISIGAPRRFDGPMGKSDRAFALGVLALMLATGVASEWRNYVLGTMFVLSLWTVFNRLRQALLFSAPPTR
ncbi:MAG: CDP-alcohol phosphatidyltransferase family protein [Massilia sp.]